MTNEAKIKLSAEGVQQVVNAFRQVQQEANRTGIEGAKGIGVLNKSLSGLKTIVAAVGVGALIVHLKEKAKAAIEAADAVGDLAAITGATTETISLFAFAARESGASLEQMKKGIFTLAQQLDALKGKDHAAEELFRRIQLSAKDFKGLNFDQSIIKVTQRLGELAGSEGTVTVAAQLLGKKNVDLLEVFGKMSEEGIGPLTERAKALGVIFSNDLTEAADRAKKAMGDLQAKSEAATVQFLSGLAPALDSTFDSLNDVNESGAVFRATGQFIGVVVVGLTTLVSFFGKVIAGAMAQLANYFTLVVDTFTAVKNFDLKAVGKAYVDFSKNTRNTMSAIWEDFTAPDEPLPPLAIGKPNKKKPPGDNRNLADISKVEKAKFELQKAALENELKLFNAHLALKSDAEKRAFENGLISLEQYFAKRREALKAESSKEIETLEAKRAIILRQPVRDPGDAEKKARELSDINEQLAEKRIENERKLKDIIQEERVAVRDLGRERLQLDEQLLVLEGRRFAAARAALVEEVKRADELLRRQGVGDNERATLVGRLEVQGNRAIDFDEQHDKAESAVRDLDRATAEIRRQVETGLLGQIEGEQRVVALQQQKLPLLQAEADKLLTIAQLTGDTTKVDQARQFQEAVRDIGVAANQTGRDLAEIRGALESSAVNEGADFFNDIITDSKTADQAISNFGKNVLATFKSIISKKLSEKLFGSLFGGGGDLGGGLLSLFGLGTGTVQKKAEGGKIVGPGTGTSDSILAAGPMGKLLRVANGEFVVRAAVVRQPGAEAFLHAFNRGLRMPSLLPMARVPRFAAGGPIGGGQSGSMAAAYSPAPVQVVVSPDMAHLTLRDWLESHLARELATR